MLLQRLDDRAGHPPQLEHRLARGHLFEFVSHFGQHRQILVGSFAADPAHQSQLEPRTQPPPPLFDGQGRFAVARRHRLRLPV